WHDPDLDLDCKARLDMVVPGVGLVDLKTTSDITPHGLSGAVAKYAYHMQAAWYVRAAAYSFRRMTSPEFFFVFAESKPPYDVSVRRLGWDAIMQGWAECVDAARRIKAYERTGEAPTASPVPLEIGLPAWAVMRDIEFRDDIPPLLRGVGNEK
ncbi:MAG TPA: hypothetical protein ENK11_02875, partial [Phycisphaerales bacterium]|nr:hypothetical protein [Phycisphaerales bacterium]